ncbi:hypothetical protein [Nocardia sp. NPDC127526]|uniref:hypothetical protein n=1 Tax=Nocardia sp. NPDC127526 TaxID=3345393 RepID=UPI003645DD20
MPRHRSPALAVLTVVLLGLAGCTTTVDDPAPPAGRELFAYSTSGELIVAEGAEVLSRTPVQIDTETEIRFTADGKYVVAREFAKDDDTAALIAVNVAQPDQVIRLQCNCRSFVPAGDSTIAWITAETVMRVDLAAAQPEPAARHTLPAPAAREGSFYTDRLLAADGDRLLWARTEFSFLTHGFRSELFLVAGDGADRLLGDIPDVDSSVHGAAFSPDGNAAAVISDTTPYGDVHPYGCPRAAITLVDLRPETQRTVFPVLENCSTPRKVRWDNEIGLTVAIGQRERNESNTSARTYRWQYADDQWSPVDGPVVDRLRPSVVATIELAEPTSGSAHTLYRIADGERVRLADGVHSIATPPGIAG